MVPLITRAVSNLLFFIIIGIALLGNMLPFLIFHISRLVWVVRRYLEAEVYFQQTVHFLAYYENEGKVKPVPYQKAQPKNHIILWCTGKFIEFCKFTCSNEMHC